MKKLLVLILTVCLLTAPGAIAFAEESTDLSGYSDSELLTLLAEVQAEIAARKIEKTANLTAGTYIGGRDIPVGNYILTAAGSEDEHGIVSLRSVNDPLDDYPFLFKLTRPGARQVFSVLDPSLVQSMLHTSSTCVRCSKPGIGLCLY